MALVDKLEEAAPPVHRAAVGEPFDQVGVEERDRNGEQRPARVLQLHRGVRDHREPECIDEAEVQEAAVQRTHLFGAGLRAEFGDLHGRSITEMVVSRARCRSMPCSERWE